MKDGATTEGARLGEDEGWDVVGSMEGAKEGTLQVGCLLGMVDGCSVPVGACVGRVGALVGVGSRQISGRVRSKSSTGLKLWAESSVSVMGKA